MNITNTAAVTTHTVLIPIVRSAAVIATPSVVCVRKRDEAPALG
jgi:hypothetical protein